MNILITGICGFVGSILAETFVRFSEGVNLVGFDNFSRAGSELNRGKLQKLGITVLHADVRSQADVDALPSADWVIDCAANPSVLAGTVGSTGPRQLLDNNLVGTINLLEYCRQRRAGFILLSTSRVYNIPGLTGLKYELTDASFRPSLEQSLPVGVSVNGVSELYSTEPPLSLYGTSKLCSELLALEYGGAFGLPVWINRCGVLAGAGQFARADQGIFAYWIHSWLAKRPMKYIGFGGTGFQTRDVMHPRDLVPLLLKQMGVTRTQERAIINVGGGVANSMSLAQLSVWCSQNLGVHRITPDLTPRPFDLPWFVTDSGAAIETWNWAPTTQISEILEEIADYARQHPDWLTLTAA